ncbi:glutaredoxin family protein [Bacillus salitolerans]|uniref:Glutaredoxin family protein n=1 Tax=Bacillus salitolerans TaxID=1437434 RepID=A0ABW4LWG7_9BACI
MRVVTFFTKENCPLCDKAKVIVEELSKELNFQIQEFDIYKDDELLEKYQVMIPVIAINAQELGYGIIDKFDLKEKLLQKLD